MASVAGTWKLHAHKVTTNHHLDTSVDLTVTKGVNNVWTASFKTMDGTTHTPTVTSASDVTEFDLASGTTTIKAKLFDSELVDVIIGFVYKGSLLHGGERGHWNVTDADVFIATRTGQ